MNDCLTWPITEAVEAIRNRKISSVELTNACLEQVRTADPDIHAFLEIEAERALEMAAAADATLARNEQARPLHGVPLAHKDMFFRTGRPSSCGSPLYMATKRTETATCLQRLDAASAVDIGRLNMSEFALHVHGVNRFQGPPRNPHNLAHIAGGSSGGSAAAVAAHMIFGAMGTDTGGSIRIPASYCGVVGVAPTFSRVSRHGMMPSSRTLDVAGPLARTAADCAWLLDIVSGPDPLDPFSAKLAPVAAAPVLNEAISGRTLGILHLDLVDRTGAESQEVYTAAIRKYEQAGVGIREVALGDLDAINALAAIVLLTETAQTHREALRDHWQDYHPEVLNRLLAGFAVPAASYTRALAERANVCRKFCETALVGVDAILVPAATAVAPRFSDVVGRELAPNGKQAVHDVASTLDPGLFTRATNYLGLPSVVHPAGTTDDELPIGVQLIGLPFSEHRLLNLVHCFEQA